jgi:SAM-dependent methyltransferase
MFVHSAQIYDAIYQSKGKKYDEEATRLRDLLRVRGIRDGSSLLEIACGTGNHTRYLREWYRVEGLDLDPGMLEIARAKYPDVPFHCGSMVEFSLGRRFDAVICLFSAIGYAKTLKGLGQAMRTMAAHLVPGGTLFVEPWIGPDEYRTGAVFSTFVDLPELKIARMNVNERRDDVSVIRFSYLVGTPEGIRHFTELHELGLYTKDQYAAAFRQAGLSVEWEAEGLIGRGMYAGRKT